MHFSEGVEILAAINDAFLFTFNVRKAPGLRSLSTGFVEALEHVYDEGCGIQVKRAAENGDRRTLLVARQ